MAPKPALAPVFCVALAMLGTPALADDYRAGEFFGLDLSQAVLSPSQFTQNQELLALSPAGLTRWENAWSKFKAG